MCLEKLINKKDIKISRTIIPYKIYYFSTNIDDYFFGEQNLEENKKIQFSYIIRSKYENEPQLYKKYICENNVAPGSYAETWNFAKSGDNSLQRLTNFNKFLEKHI